MNRRRFLGWLSAALAAPVVLAWDWVRGDQSPIPFPPIDVVGAKTTYTAWTEERSLGDGWTHWYRVERSGAHVRCRSVVLKGAHPNDLPSDAWAFTQVESWEER